MLIDQLQDYLHYMTELNYTGLQLSHSPFKSTTTRSVPQPGSRAARLVSGTVPQAQTKPSPKPTPNATNLVSLVDMVDLVSAEEENQTKVEAIRGKDANDVLNQLFNTFKHCEACPLGTTRTKFVFGEGPPNAELMFIGEGPGRDEDMSGRPFVGRAGQLLNKIIEAMGYRRDQVFIANVVKCRPPGNRTPLPDEMAACSPILRRQINAVNPKMIVVLGSTALRFFAGASVSITRMRGRFLDWEGRRIMPTFHPAYILRNPRAKRDVWEDMKIVMAGLKG